MLLALGLPCELANHLQVCRRSMQPHNAKGLRQVEGIEKAKIIPDKQSLNLQVLAISVHES